MQGDENKTTIEILFEIRRDVKWICLALQEIKECREDEHGGKGIDNSAVMYRNRCRCRGTGDGADEVAGVMEE